MFAFATDRRLPDIVGRLKSAPALCIGILIGVIMPLVAAWVYPTYMHKMPSPLQEWTRLQEIPFVLSEVLVICWAIGRGMEIRHIVAKLPRDCLIAGCIFLVGLWASTLLVSKVPPTSFVISVSYVIHLLFGFSVYHLISKAKKELLDQLTSGFAWGLVALAALTAWRFLLPPPAWAVPGGQIEWHAALPGFISVRHFGSWTGAIAAIFAAMLIQRREEAAFSWHDLAYMLAAGLTIWSGTRAAVLAIAISCAVLIVGTWRFPSLRVIGRLSILTGIAACLAWLLIPYNDSNFYLIAPEDALAGGTGEISSGRWEMWITAWKAWLQAPWFGWGSGSTLWEVRALGWTHTQPHNFVLQFLVSWGLVGACSAFWLLGRAVIGAHRRTLASPQLWPMLTGLYTLLVMACLEGMLHYPRFIMLIFVLLAVIYRFGSTQAEPS
jgi:exopolysaccharide production protein ExoQ